MLVRDADELKRDAASLRRSVGGLGFPAVRNFHGRRRPRDETEEERRVTAVVARTLARRTKNRLSQIKHITTNETAFESAFSDPFKTNGVDCYGNLGGAASGSGFAFGLLSAGKQIVYNSAPTSALADTTRQTNKVLLRRIVISGRWVGNTELYGIRSAVNYDATGNVLLRMLHGKYHCIATDTTSVASITPAFLLSDYYARTPQDTRDLYKMGYWAYRPQRPLSDKHRWHYQHIDHLFASKARRRADVYVADQQTHLGGAAGAPVSTGFPTGPVVGADQEQLPGLVEGVFTYEIHPHCVLQWDETTTSVHPLEPHIILFQAINDREFQVGVFYQVEIYIEWQDFIDDE